MKKGRFSEAQIVAILQQQQSGQTVAQIVREHGLSEATFYTWKSKYAGASVAELTRLDSLFGQGSPFVASVDIIANLAIARGWQASGNPARARPAAARLSNTNAQFAAVPGSLREKGRLLLAAGDTVGAMDAWRLYLRPRGDADPDQRKVDDEIRKTLAEIERKKR